MNTQGAANMATRDYEPAKSLLIDAIVETLQAHHDDWYAEQDTNSTITLRTPFGHHTLVIVEEETTDDD